MVFSHKCGLNTRYVLSTVYVPIGAEQDVRHPVRRSAHLLTDHIQVNIRAAFDDQLIMNVTDDEAVPESFHGVAEDVAADSLDDVLHELRTVGFDAFPKKYMYDLHTLVNVMVCIITLLN